MPVTRAGGQPGVNASRPISIPPGSKWRPSPSLEQARQSTQFIRRGQAGPSVQQLQQLLNAAGTRPPLQDDGLFGPRTQAAVRRFQAKHGLSQDGIVGPQTLGVLAPSTTVADGVSFRRRRSSDNVVGNSSLGNAGGRAPGLGAESPTSSGGVYGLLSGRGGLSRSDIDWSNPRIRPPGGRVTKPSAEAFKAAVNAYEEAERRGQVRNHKMTLIDYSRPSTEPRMWIIDMNSKKLLAQHRVSHGSGSNSSRDARMASRFSNRSGSHQSSLGTYITAETYSGNNGRSLKLDGKEGGFNSAARNRAIVMHQADYASDAFVRRNGYMGRSHGCPAMDPAVAQSVIDMIKGGSPLLIYAQDSEYLRRSDYIRGD